MSEEIVWKGEASPPAELADEIAAKQTTIVRLPYVEPIEVVELTMSVANRDMIIAALRAAPTGNAPEPVAWPNDEQVWDCIRLTFGEKIAGQLSFKRWKDGIDLDYPTSEAMSFARQLFAMGLAAAAPASNAKPVAWFKDQLGEVDGPVLCNETDRGAWPVFRGPEAK